MITMVTVTERHISTGKAADCERCPVARAIADAIPGLAYIGVFAHGIDLQRSEDEDEISAHTPDEVAEFIEAFDNGRPVSPFTFTLDIPEPAVTP